MKIAFLTPILPYPADTGGKIRSYNILKNLADKHTVHVITVHGEPTHDATQHIQSLGATVLHIHAKKSPGLVPRLRRIAKRLPHHIDAFATPQSLKQVQSYLLAESFDVLFCDEIVMTPYVKGMTGVKRVLALQNIDYQLRQQIASQESFGRQKLSMQLEVNLLKSYSERVFAQDWDDVIVCSSADADVVKAANSTNKVTIVPNGVDLDFFSRTGKQPDVEIMDDMPTLLFVGTMFYYPNIDAMRYFFSAVYPFLQAVLPAFRICIVGHSPPPEIEALPNTYPNVIVTGSVEDVRPYYEQSTVVIVPLRLGGGTSLKIVQGLAMQRPIVSTSIGARGLGLEPGEEILLADTPKVFARAITDLVLDTSLRKSFIDKSAKVAERFRWSTLAADVREACEALVDEPESTETAAVTATKPPAVKRDNPLRILAVSNLYPPYVIGGYEMLAFRTMEALRERGHEIHVATGHGRELKTNVHGIYDLDLDNKEDTFLTPVDGRRNKLKHFLFHPGHYRATQKLIEQVQPDVVSAWNLYLITVAPMIAARRMGYPVVTHLTDHWLVNNVTKPAQQTPGASWINRTGMRAIRSAVQPVLYRQTDMNDLIIPSHSLRQVYLDAGFDFSAFHFLPHGISTDKFPYRERGEHDGPTRLLFVGQLWAGKGPQVILHALGELVRGGETDLHLDIYGKGEPGFMDHLDGIIKQEGIEDYVSFCGTVPHDELVDVFYEHDLLIFPSTWNEPFALTPVEAMASGLPVIASDAGGTKEVVIDGENGIVVPADQPTPLADAIRILMNDADKRRVYGKRSADKVHADYSFEGMVDTVEEIYYAARERAKTR